MISDVCDEKVNVNKIVPVFSWIGVSAVYKSLVHNVVC